MKKHNLKMCRGGSVVRRLLPLFISFLVSTAFALAPTSSLKTCGTAADQTGDALVAWTNPTNAQGVNDGVYATAPSLFTDSPDSDNLKCTNYSFTSSDVPVGATINGIEVVIRNKSSSSTAPGKVQHIFAVKGGTIQSTDLGPGSPMTTSDRDDTYGTTSNLWGTTWVQTDITSSGFGVAFSYEDTNGVGRTMSVDSVQIQVTYTAAATSHKALLLLGVGLVIPGGPMFVPLPPLPQTTSWHRPNAYAL